MIIVHLFYCVIQPGPLLMQCCRVLKPVIDYRMSMIVDTSQVTFHNILSFSLVEDNLSRNFSLIFKLFEDQAKRIKAVNDSLIQKFAEMEERVAAVQTSQDVVNKELREKDSLAWRAIEDLSIFKMNQEDTNLSNANSLSDLLMDLSSLRNQAGQTKSKTDDLAIRLLKVERSAQQNEVNHEHFKQELDKKGEKVELAKVKKESQNLYLKVESMAPVIKQLQQRIKYLVQKNQHNQLQLENLNSIREEETGLQTTSDKTAQLSATASKAHSNQKSTQQKMEEIEARFSAVEQCVQKLKHNFDQDQNATEEQRYIVKGLLQQFQRQSSERRVHEAEVNEKIAILGVGFNQNQFRVDSYEEELVSQKKYFQKVKSEHDTLNLWLKDLNLKKVGEQIKTMQVEHNLLRKEYEEKLDKKVSISDMKDQSEQVGRRFREIEDQLRSKTDRASVKKALMFFQTKLKEIVTVLNSKESTQTESLLSRRGYFCLSCDKVISDFKGQQNIQTERRRGLRGSGHVPKNTYGLSLSARRLEQSPRLSGDDSMASLLPKL